LFITTLAEACAEPDWLVHAYGLMGNHFQLVVEMPQGNLVAEMKRSLDADTSRLNRLAVRAARRQGGTSCSVTSSAAVTRRW